MPGKLSSRISERHQKLALIWKRSNKSAVVMDCQSPSNAKRVRLDLYQARRNYLNLPPGEQDPETLEAMQLNCAAVLEDPFSRCKCLLSLGRGSTDYLIEGALREIAKEDATQVVSTQIHPPKSPVELGASESARELMRSKEVLNKFNVKAALEELGSLKSSRND